ncbi:MAG: hypothetical protein RIR24_289 [Actinomycetota bacterium]
MSALISSQILRLRSADKVWRCEVSPTGASLVSLWHRDVELVTSPNNEPLYALAGSVMAPWPNRLEDATWQMQDREFKTAINDSQGNNANHGLVFAKDFELVSQTDSSLKLEISLFDENAYPFRVSLTVSFEITNNGLDVKLEAKNLDTESVPIAFGMHPYFVLDQRSQLLLDSETWITKNARNLPVSASTFEMSPLGNDRWKTIYGLEIDDCFTDLNFENDGFCITTITRPEHQIEVDIAQSKELSHLMLYGLSESKHAHRALLAVEPQSAPANAFKHLEQVTMLAPAETFAASYRISIRSVE